MARKGNRFYGGGGLRVLLLPSEQTSIVLWQVLRKQMVLQVFSRLFELGESWAWGTGAEADELAPGTSLACFTIPTPSLVFHLLK